jgi:hypothetical protein
MIKKYDKMMKCDIHPRYQAKRKPVKTKNHPNGCDRCWTYYNWKTLGCPIPA